MPEPPLLRLRARGPLAVFTQPALKVERISYPIMTPSAARGVLEAVLWKPGMRWHVRRILVLSPIEFIAFRRNEVNSKAPAPSATLIRDGGTPPRYYADEDRAQRNTVALRNVDYVIESDIGLTDRAGPDDNLTKFVEMFRRRLEKGQHFHQPYLGCREFPAEVLQADGAPAPIQETRDLGIMLWDIAFGPHGNRPIFFRSRLRNGVLDVPADPEATLAQGDTT
jgi:CRISPR-associated protein Cas5d